MLSLATAATALPLRLFEEPRPRVVGGVETSFNRYPFVVALLKDGEFFCGGSLVSPNLVLTAAHCITESSNPAVYQVSSSRHTLSTPMGPDQPEYLDPEVDNPECGDTVAVAQLVPHPEYDPDTVQNDLALLVLSDAVKCSDQIAFATLDHGENSGPGNELTVAGWGALYDPSYYPMFGTTITPGVLHEAEVRTFGSSECNALLCGPIFGFLGLCPYLDGPEMCAGNLLGGVDACAGDSGGPLFRVGDDGVPVLVGVTSWGFGCAEPLTPGVYTRVARYREWVDSYRCSQSEAHWAKSWRLKPTAGCAPAPPPPPSPPPSPLPPPALMEAVLQGGEHILSSLPLGGGR